MHLQLWAGLPRQVHSGTISSAPLDIFGLVDPSADTSGSDALSIALYGFRGRGPTEFVGHCAFLIPVRDKVNRIRDLLVILCSEGARVGQRSSLGAASPAAKY